MRIPYHNKADGFMAALLLTLNQVKFCELHRCQPRVEWGPFPACKYTGVRFPGRTPFFDAEHGGNAFLYYFRPICHGFPRAQEVAPALTCEQREQVHRVLPWALRTYYYGAAQRAANDTYDGAWYGAQRVEGARLARTYLRLQPRVAARLESLSSGLLGRVGPMRSGSGDGVDDSGRGSDNGGTPRRGPILGVHLRGTDKGKYLQTAGSGRPIGPDEYEPYVLAFLRHHGPNASVFVATDSPSYLAHVQAHWPAGRVVVREGVLRHEDNIAFAGGGRKRISGAHGGGSGGGNHRKGEEVLLDSLLLSRCDFLLHAASGVAEFAIYWGPHLHAASVHLQYVRERQVPAWMHPSSGSGHLHAGKASKRRGRKRLARRRPK